CAKPPFYYSGSFDYW
nr:immunoglobulin heavy chain junction region [Macaca mulatta]MOW87237.1 immunoglobulin heavy chain junction region [Macaca mulatta]MOW88213.1 immunoglobulin heavy chain junction region [Macaca mulatta]MOW88378.1 immunoglobulin heavy chain junction region [Macaca mulatta]MOW88510.1 immunoglobulin heavy chain junction region [Macaca mulatta]